jgi:hypothetical protein
VHFKCPRVVEFGPLPKTSTGKIQKFRLRERGRATARWQTVERAAQAAHKWLVLRMRAAEGSCQESADRFRAGYNAIGDRREGQPPALYSARSRLFVR